MVVAEKEEDIRRWLLKQRTMTKYVTRKHIIVKREKLMVILFEQTLVKKNDIGRLWNCFETNWNGSKKQDFVAIINFFWLRQKE
ncbi:Peptidyl-prolyl cis-trans isomerase [Dirofilaria immitis]